MAGTRAPAMEGLHGQIGAAAIQQQVLPHDEARVLRTKEGTGRAELVTCAITPRGDARLPLGAGFVQRDAA